MCLKSTIICERIKSDQVLFILGSERFVYIPFHAVHSFPEIQLFHKSTCQNTHSQQVYAHVLKSWAIKTLCVREFGTLEQQDMNRKFESKPRH